MVARQDMTTDPVLQEELLTARRGTAFFSRKLNELSDEALDAPSLLPGWSRRHLIAHVGYNARALSRLVHWANTGQETPMYSSPEARNREIDYGATLSPAALRHLHTHAAIHLNVEWRDLPEEKWSHQVKTAQGRTVPASETIWMRSREVWIHAIDLNNGARFTDIPAHILERLLKDITGAWHMRGDDNGLLLQPIGAPTITELGDTASPDSAIITGTLANLAAWACGRNADGITSSEHDQPPTAPRWI